LWKHLFALFFLLSPYCRSFSTTIRLGSTSTGDAVDRIPNSRTFRLFAVPYTSVVTRRTWDEHSGSPATRGGCLHLPRCWPRLVVPKTYVDVPVLFLTSGRRLLLPLPRPAGTNMLHHYLGGHGLPVLCISADLSHTLRGTSASPFSHVLRCIRRATAFAVRRRKGHLRHNVAACAAIIPYTFPDWCGKPARGVPHHPPLLLSRYRYRRKGLIKFCTRCQKTRRCSTLSLVRCGCTTMDSVDNACHFHYPPSPRLPHLPPGSFMAVLSCASPVCLSSQYTYGHLPLPGSLYILAPAHCTFSCPTCLPIAVQLSDSFLTSLLCFWEEEEGGNRL